MGRQATLSDRVSSRRRRARLLREDIRDTRAMLSEQAKTFEALVDKVDVLPLRSQALASRLEKGPGEGSLLSMPRAKPKFRLGAVPTEELLGELRRRCER